MPPFLAMMRPLTEPALMATQLSIAKQLNLSKATVSRILSGNTSHDDATRARVLSLAARLGYRHLRPTVRQRVTRTRKSVVIGVILEVSDATPAEVPVVTMRALRGISAAARMENATVQVHHFPMHERFHLPAEEFAWLQEDRSGLILAGGFTPAVIRELTRKVHCVRLNNRESNVDVDCVGQNDADAVERLVVHLDALGHRRVGLLRGAEDEWPTKARQAGYFGALAQRGWQSDLHIVACPPSSGSETDWKHCRQKVADKISSGVRAWICEHDGLGYEWVHWLQGSGFRVPQDVSVCAFDNLGSPGRKLPKLTTIDWPFEDIGAAAVRRLLRRIQEPAASPVYMQLNGRLVEGKSTGPCPPSRKRKVV